MAPRGNDETDAQYKARQVELGKFNEKMYGKKPAMPSTRPTMAKEPMPPRKLPTKGLVRPTQLPTKGPRPPIRPTMIKEPMPSKVAPTEVPMRGDVFLPTGGRAPAKKLSPPGPPPRIPASVIADYERTAAKLAAPTPMKKAAGGAAKVRKGMMSPEGKILHAMNKVRGK
jgi:hypothetical protein